MELIYIETSSQLSWDRLTLTIKSAIEFVNENLLLNKNKVEDDGNVPTRGYQGL